MDEEVQEQSTNSRVLIVDDSPEDLEAIERTLKDLPVDLVRASSGSEAIQLALDDDFALVLADVRMPEMGGFELAELMRSDERTAQIPVILITGIFEDSSHRARGYESGAADIISKPLEPVALRCKVNIFCELRRNQIRLEREMKVRHEAESERENWRKLVKGIMKNADAVIYVKALDGRYLLVNSQYLGIFGLEEKDVIGRKDEDIFPAEYAAKFREADGEVVRKGEPIRFEEIVPLEDGDHQYISTKFPIRDENDEIYATAGVSADITELKSTEQALRVTQSSLAELNNELELRVEQRTAELLEANKELDQFTYVASHDLQEPLRKQMMFTDVLNDEMHGELSEDAARALRAINSGAHRMQNLIQSLLSLSRTRNREPNLELCTLSTVVEDALSALELRIRDKKVGVVVGDLPRIPADRVLLAQVFQNLIGNAVLYCRVNVQPRVEVSGVVENGEVEISVKDNGIGIGTESLEMIFEPFKRLHTRNEYDGTGIGLAVCKKIVERHGGRIWAESTPDSGSSFKFVLKTNMEEEKLDV